MIIFRVPPCLSGAGAGAGAGVGVGVGVGDGSDFAQLLKIKPAISMSMNDMKTSFLIKFSFINVLKTKFPEHIKFLYWYASFLFKKTIV
jgi:hypothetical protein